MIDKVLHAAADITAAATATAGLNAALITARGAFGVRHVPLNFSGVTGGCGGRAVEEGRSGRGSRGRHGRREFFEITARLGKSNASRVGVENDVEIVHEISAEHRAAGLGEIDAKGVFPVAEVVEVRGHRHGDLDGRTVDKPVELKDDVWHGIESRRGQSNAVLGRRKFNTGKTFKLALEIRGYCCR